MAGVQLIKRQSGAACSTASLYKAPVGGVTVNASEPLQMAWDISCFPGVKVVGVQLYQPYKTDGSPLLFVWESVDYTLGYLERPLNPGLWGNAPTVQLNIAIVEAGGLPIPTQYGPSAIFTASFDPTSVAAANMPKVDPSKPESKYEVVKNWVKKHIVSPGGIAAAVIVPLLFVAAIAAFFYIRHARKKTTTKSKRFSQALDKRMSTISHDWRSTSAAGAQAAIRQSMATFGRPVSVVIPEGNHGSSIGVGRRAPPSPETAARTRASRVSFAAESYLGRPSQSIYDRNSRFGDLPPLPTRQDSGEKDNNSPLTMSPRQTQGPFSLSPEEIRTRIDYSYTRQAAPSPHDEDVLPALKMMRTGSQDAAAGDDFLFAPAPPPTSSHRPISPPKAMDIPLPPVPAVLAAPMQSPIAQSPMGSVYSPPGEASMTPDAMMRAYAAAKAKGNTSAIGVPMPVTPRVMSPPPMPMYGSPATTPMGMAFPSPPPQAAMLSPTGTGNGMRTLYAPNGSAHNPFRISAAPTVGSAYSGVDGEDAEESYLAYGTAK